MILIKGNLTIDKTEREPLPPLSLMTQNRKRTSSAFESNDSKPKEITLIISYATLEDYDTSDAIIIDGDVVVSDVDYNGTLLVTGEVAEIGGEYAS